MDQNTSSTGSPSSSLFQFYIDAPAIFMLRSAASWAKAMAIVGILIALVFFALAFLIQNAFNQAGGSFENLLGDRGVSKSDAQIAVTFYMVFFIVIGLIFLISGIFSFSFSNRIATALRTTDQNSLRSAFAAARNLFAFRTIILIICLLILLIFLFSAINGGGNADAGRFD